MFRAIRTRDHHHHFHAIILLLFCFSMFNPAFHSDTFNVLKFSAQLYGTWMDLNFHMILDSKGGFIEYEIMEFPSRKISQ